MDERELRELVRAVVEGAMAESAGGSATGPGTAPELNGPTLSEPPLSIQTTLPPPAPTSDISITGSLSA